MMVDKALLQVIKYRDAFKKVYQFVPMSGIDKRTKLIVKDFLKYFSECPNAAVIDLPAFRSLFFTSWHKNLKDDEIAYYNAVFDMIVEDADVDVANMLINQLVELELATDAAHVIDKYQAGDDIEIVQSLKKLTEKASDNLAFASGGEFADENDTTIGEDMDDGGMEWNLDCLNRVYRNILAGDQYIIAARPGKGKTSFITHLNYAMAQQMPKEKVIVWFNNESKRQRIMSRQVQSALGKTNTELSEMTIEDRTQLYAQAMGRAGRVRVFDIHRKNHLHLEKILDDIGKDNIGAIICDMLDNVAYPTDAGTREDQRLESLYKWFRECGVIYNCPTFPTSQISNEGAELLYPLEGMLKDSKTGKQGACDGIIMLGSIGNDPLMEHTRGVSMPKSKSKRAGMGDLREEVRFDADIGRYIG